MTAKTAVVYRLECCSVEEAAPDCCVESCISEEVLRDLKGIDSRVLSCSLQPILMINTHNLVPDVLDH